MEAVRLDIEILTCGDSTSGLAFVDGLIWFCGVVQVVICIHVNVIVSGNCMVA